MARKVVVTLIDDYDGTSTAEETVTFGIDGHTYEIDLSETNATKLRNTFEQWDPYARRTGRTKTTTTRRNAVTTTTAVQADRRNDLPAIRAWALANGHTVSTRGRIAAQIIAAYDATST
ncbi:histone-like nucleoid-structuring protein Lsr2 [Nocardia ignorata]|uniref:Lsr2 protein n=1 Tax=Nocardia ignorata TaxID=145285 RepID=A0A4R6NYB7_NOCIG|nr:Lsr2 family protein [Nocardia ignorata]TDP28417.1 Lsr2 protein [Nocardia ignorata]